MKDSRFIELVNLYVDRQISAEETAELEAEIQASPGRRAVYHQYCQMQSATKLVYASFRTDAAEAPAGTATARATVTRFEGVARRQPRWGYYTAGLAAACVAVVFTVRLNSHAPVEPQLVVAAPVISQPAKIAAVPVPTEKRAGLGNLRANLNADQDYAAMVAALRQEEQRAFASSQGQSGRVPSLFEDGVFDAQQGSTVNSLRTFRNKPAPGAQAEFTAFQFQR